MPELRQLEYLPEALLTAAPEQLYQLLDGPTLIHLSGKHTPALFVSVLLHGNEPTGFLALQQLLRKYSPPLPRAVSFFIGNVQAASFDRRRLDNQPDYNRVWPGTASPPNAETRLMQAVYDTMRDRQVFASIDIHNNTGLNPHYACINRIDNRFIRLATLFGRLVVYFTHPKGVQSAAMAELCPAVTLECGRPGHRYGVEHALDYLETCLHLEEISDDPVPERTFDIYHTVAQVKPTEDISFSFQQENCDLLLNADLEKLNFTEIEAGTVFGQVRNSDTLPIVAINALGNEVTEQFFQLKDSRLEIIRAAMPSMLTRDETVIKQDCLCYLMEKMPA